MRNTVRLVIGASLTATLACSDGPTRPEANPPVEPAVATVTVSPGTVTLMPDLSWSVKAEARLADGRPVARAVTWTTSDAAIARVDAQGSITAVTAGNARITAAADRVSATVDVVVIANHTGLSITSGDSLLATPEARWSLRGPGLTGLTVLIDNMPAQVTLGGDALATVVVPALPAFRPCLSRTTMVAIMTTATAGIAVRVPAEAPFVVDLAVGRRQALDPAVARRCEIRLTSGGYILAAAVVDRASAMRAGVLVADSVTIIVSSGEADAEPGAGRGPATRPVRGLIGAAGATTSDLMPISRGVHPTGAPTPGTCAVINAVGDSVLIPTSRDEQGRFVWGDSNRDEWWYLVEQTRALNLVLDSGAARVWRTNAHVRAEMRLVMKVYETEWQPIFDELYADPLPDMDGNGRMIFLSAWNSAVGGGGGTGEYLQADCPERWRFGEAFYVPMDMYSDDPERTPPHLRPYFFLVAHHEASHTHDLARRTARFGHQRTWYSSQVPTEGVASFTTAYWLLKRTGNALLGNHDRPGTTVAFEGMTLWPESWAIHPRISGTYHWTSWAGAGGYAQSLQFITWAAAQAVRAGRPVSSVLTGLSYGNRERATYGSVYRDATGTQLEDDEVLIRWGLSWLVDDRVPGADPELGIPTWNTARIYETEPPPAALPRAVLNGSGRAVLHLGEPDIGLIEIGAGDAHRLSVAVMDRGAAARLRVEILRAR